MVNYNLGPLVGSACDTLVEIGIEELLLQKSIMRIYPNPSSDKLTIEVLNALLQDGQGIAPQEIEIINSLGVTVLKLKQIKSTSQVNIKSLAGGIYFVKVRMTDGSVTVKKVVKE